MTGPRRALGIAALLLGAGAASACAGAPPPGGIDEIGGMGEIAMVLASYEEPFTVEGERFQVSIDAPENPSGRVALVLHGGESPRSSVVYDLYAGLPPDADPEGEESPYHLGTLEPFGPADEDWTGRPIPVPARASYDLTALVKRLAAEGRWGSSLELTFVRREPEPPALEAATDPGAIRIDFVRIVRRKG